MKIVLAIVALGLLAADPTHGERRESAFRGKRIAETECGGCHGIGQFDGSSIAQAPPFRVIAGRISRGDLIEMLQGPVFLKHEIMPDFEPTREQAADLTEYMLSIAGQP